MLQRGSGAFARPRWRVDADATWTEQAMVPQLVALEVARIVSGALPSTEGAKAKG
jgi:hypothetical protein